MGDISGSGLHKVWRENATGVNSTIVCASYDMECMGEAIQAGLFQRLTPC